MSLRKTLGKVNHLRKRNLFNDEEKEQSKTNRNDNRGILSNDPAYEFNKQKQLSLSNAPVLTCAGRPPLVNFPIDPVPFPPSNTAPYWANNINTYLIEQTQDSLTVVNYTEPYSTISQWASIPNNSYILITSAVPPYDFEISKVSTITITDNNTVILNLAKALSQTFDAGSSVNVYPDEPVPSLYIPFAYFLNGNVSIETSKLDENDCVITVKIPDDFVNCYVNKESTPGNLPGLNTKWKTAIVPPVLLKCHNFKPKKMLAASGGGAGGTMFNRNSWYGSGGSRADLGDDWGAGGGGAGSLAKIDNINSSGDYITSPFTLNDFVYCCIGKGGYASKALMPAYFASYDALQDFNNGSDNPVNSGGNTGEDNYYTSPCGGPTGIVIKNNISDPITKATQWWFYAGGAGGGNMTRIPCKTCYYLGKGQDGGSGGGGAISPYAGYAGPAGTVALATANYFTFTDGTGNYPKGLDYFTILANDGGNTSLSTVSSKSSGWWQNNDYPGGGGGGGGALGKGGDSGGSQYSEGGTGGQGYLLQENGKIYAAGGRGGYGVNNNAYLDPAPTPTQNTGSGGFGGNCAQTPATGTIRTIQDSPYSSGPYIPLTTSGDGRSKSVNLNNGLGTDGANGTIVFVAKKTALIILDNSTDDSMIKQLPKYGLENYYHYKVPTPGISYEGQSYND